MQFRRTQIADVCEVVLDTKEDERGYFARLWCVQEFAAVGLPTFVQSSLSYNRQRGTVRGLHFQWPPSQEGKLVRCEHGAVYDVVVDLRPASATFLNHVAVELTAARGNALFIPPGVAHGFQTLADDARVNYAMSDFYAPQFSDGVRWNDATFGITWPLPVSVISVRDRDYPDFDPERHAARFEVASS